jgi:hypothetical protein
MKFNSVTSKIFLSIFAFGFSIWFGGTLLRSAIAFDLFEPSTKLELKSYYSNEIRMHSTYLFATLGIYTDIGYAASFFAAMALFIYWRKNLKTKGWMLMAFILFFITVPVEFLLIYYDIKLSIAIYYDKIKDFANPAIKDYFLARIQNTSIATPTALAFLASITTILYLVWRPLDKTVNIQEETHKL